MSGIFFDNWELPSTEGGSLKEILLSRRAMISDKEIHSFFHDSFPEALHNPSLLKDYKKAIQRIIQAVEKKERIVIFGDYDVDGTVGTSILVEILERVGAIVSYRIPHRRNDGYGLKKYFIDEMQEKGVTLLITVDNGISAVKEVAHAKMLGIDVIITDHHIVQDELPGAFAVVNQKQEDCEYPYSELCGTALAYKIALGIAEYFFEQEQYELYQREKLDLVALATVADCMPLKGENRVIVKEGLKVIRETKNKGLQALMKAGKISPEAISSETFAFQFGPRINAAGRISQAYIALQLLLGKTEFAEELELLNEKRKQLVENAFKNIKGIKEGNLIIQSSPDWHTGIIGLIAGRLTEKHALPSIILEEQENKLVASCRAPESFDMFQFLLEFKDYFEHFGGHAQAAGFSIKKEKFLEFKENATRSAGELLQKKPIQKTLRVSTEITEDHLILATVEELSDFEPFGIGNEKPYFLLRNIENIIWSTMGDDGKHLQGKFLKKNGEVIRIYKFFAGDSSQVLQKSSRFDCVVALSKNTWNGNSSLQLELIDVKVQD